MRMSHYDADLGRVPRPAPATGSAVQPIRVSLSTSQRARGCCRTFVLTCLRACVRNISNDVITITHHYDSSL